MKNLLTIILFSSFVSASNWGHNLDVAKQQAQQKHQLIVLNFSGSDWCIPCIKLRTNIFESNEFKQYADSNLVLVNADFPRLKKNMPSKEQIKLNEKMAAVYNPKGKFPYTVILNEQGKIVKAYDGYPAIAPQEFVNQLKAIVK